MRVSVWTAGLLLLLAIGLWGWYRDRATRRHAVRERAELALQERTAQLEQAMLRLQQARDTLEQRAREMERDAQTLKALMLYIPEGITIADAPDVSIRMVSRYGVALTGKPPEILEGIPSEIQVETWDIFKADGVTRPTGDELPLTRAVKQGESSTNEEWVLRQPGGRTITILCNAGPIRDAQGALIGGVIAWRDITERKQAEEQLHQLMQSLQTQAAQLQDANRELEAFCYSVSHDLRAPLRAMDGFAHLLTEHAAGHLDEESRHWLEIIQAEAKRMGRLIDDLLRFSRTSRQLMTQDEVDMTRLAREVYDECRDLEPPRPVRLHLDPLPPAQGDAALLREVWVNLLANALKFSRGRPEAEIEIGSRAEPGEQVYFVRDNGVGFEMKYVHRLFGVFQRLHTEKEFEGTGIGLALVQRIVHRHGGRTWAEGQPNAGATFFFTLPMRKEPPP